MERRRTSGPTRASNVMISDLPTELLARIFANFDTGTVLPMCLVLHDNTHIAASQVCREWRCIVSSMGQLWTTFVIDVPYNWQESSGQGDVRYNIRDWTYLNAVLGTWLKRSGGRPLSLTLGNLPDALAETVVSNVQRCQIISRLAVHTGLEASLANLQILPPLINASTVEIFSVEIQTMRARSLEALITADRLSIELLSLPRWQHLETLEWRCAMSRFPSPISVANMPNLKTLLLAGSRTADHCIQFLQKLPNLTSLTLSDMSVGSETITNIEMNGTQFVHKKIEMLDVASEKGNPFHYLAVFTFSALGHLSISSSSRSCTQGQLLDVTSQVVNESRRLLDGFISRSSCKLQSFRIAARHMPPDGFAGVLALPCLRTIESLTIVSDPLPDGECRGIKDSTIEALRYEPDIGSVNFPRLKSLELENAVSTDGLIAQVIQSRYSPGSGCAPLEDIRVAFAVEEEEDDSDSDATVLIGDVDLYDHVATRPSNRLDTHMLTIIGREKAMRVDMVEMTYARSRRRRVWGGF